MPRRVQMQLIKQRLIGKDGAERVRELRAIMSELPDYKNGLYADIRKWVLAEIESTRARILDEHWSLAMSALPSGKGAGQASLVHPINLGRQRGIGLRHNPQSEMGVSSSPGAPYSPTNVAATADQYTQGLGNRPCGRCCEARFDHRCAG